MPLEIVAIYMLNDFCIKHIVHFFEDGNVMV